MQILSGDSSRTGFKIQKEALMDFFDPDHIRDGNSLMKLSNLGIIS